MISVKKSLTYSEISKVKIPLPTNVGEHWRGIEHKEIYGAMDRAVLLKGWKTLDEKVAVSPNDANLAMSFVLAVPKQYAPKGYEYSIGVNTNNERRKALTFYMGLVHTKTKTPIVMGKVEDGVRNTTGLDLVDQVKMTFDSFEEQIQTFDEAVTCFKTRPLTVKEADHFIACACRLTIHKGKFPWSKVGLINQNFFWHMKPFTSLSLLLAFGGACKTVPPLKQMEEMNAFRELVPMNDTADVGS